MGRDSWIRIPICKVGMVAFPIWINVSTLSQNQILPRLDKDHGGTLWVVLWNPYCNGYFVIVITITNREQAI